MKTKFEIAEIICKECRVNMKENYPKNIGCAFRDLDNEYCDEILNLMLVIYEEKCSNKYVNSKICNNCKHKEECKIGF